MSWRVESGVRLADGTWRVRLVGASGERRSAAVLEQGDARWIAIDGEVHVLAAPRPGTTRRSRAADDHSLSAPMPATVVRVLVEPGQTVARGDVLVLLEAMKMELPVRAPADGTISVVACAPGELVQPGVLLVEIQ